ILTSHGLAKDLATQFASISLKDDYPVTTVIHTRQPIWIESREAYLERYPHVAPVLEMAGSPASFTLPLIVADRAIGSMGVSLAAPKRLSDEDRALLSTIAHHRAQALERARLNEIARKQATIE